VTTLILFGADNPAATKLAAAAYKHTALSIQPSVKLHAKHARQAAREPSNCLIADTTCNISQVIPGERDREKPMGRAQSQSLDHPTIQEKDSNCCSTRAPTQTEQPISEAHSLNFKSVAACMVCVSHYGFKQDHVRMQHTCSTLCWSPAHHV
jgi:hypothetical protein